jgi:hypothetical protein
MFIGIQIFAWGSLVSIRYLPERAFNKKKYISTASLISNYFAISVASFKGSTQILPRITAGYMAVHTFHLSTR